VKNWSRIVVALAVIGACLAPFMSAHNAGAASLMADTFTGSTTVGSWIAGGNPNTACLTAGTSYASAIPACDTESPESNGQGALRLTTNGASQAGFVINNTPVSTSQGLQVAFDMFQYNGSGADGIAFFLIDGSQSPTQPGAFGGSLGYSSDSVGDLGLVGGYVGVGFDVFGNFSSPQYGTNGPGAHANSITVRGSQSTGYKYVTTKAASGTLANNSATVRANAKRHVIVSINTSNIMTVYVDYENGSGPIKELSNINLNTINGAGSLPASFKFGFSASTGGSNDIHEISGLSVDTLSPNVSTTAAITTSFQQGENGQYTLTAKNDPGAESTTGDIVVNDTLPAGLTPAAATGTGWTCTISGQNVSCTRPGDGANALVAGASAPIITVTAHASESAASTLNHTVTATTANNNDVNAAGKTYAIAVATGDHDGASNATENAAPHAGDGNNDGIADAGQANVTSFVNSFTGQYATLASTGCLQVNDPYVSAVSSNTATDSAYNYPAGMMNFSIVCTNPGDTAIVTQYYYGNYDASQFVARKYDPVSKTYTDIPGATVTNVTIGGQTALKITYSITDGGPLDADGVANGTIVDPAGPAVKSAATTTASAAAASSTLTDTGINLAVSTSIAAMLIALSLLAAKKKQTASSN
jgi:hypothetical protein